MGKRKTIDHPLSYWPYESPSARAAADSADPLKSILPGRKKRKTIDHPLSQMAADSADPPKSTLPGRKKRKTIYHSLSQTDAAEVVERRDFALKKIEKPNIPRIDEVSRCQSVLLSSDVKSNLVRRMVYTNAGNGVLALTEDGTHLLWKWAKDYTNPDGEANAKHAPGLWSPNSRVLMVNSLPEDSSDIVLPCFSLSRNDDYLMSTSGKMITLYNTKAFKNMRNVMPSPPAATCILFYPPDNNIIVISMDDSSILVYHMRKDKIIRKLEGHSKRISGLAYSTKVNLLISSGVDGHIYSWDSKKWERKRSMVSQMSVNGWKCSDVSELTVELDKDEQHFLAVHEIRLAIYVTKTLLRVKQWAIANFGTKISNAKYSCDGQLIYAAMRNGIILIFAASDLTPRFEINPSVYLPSCIISSNVYPIVVAAHPKKPNQFALGLSDGRVAVLEPVESEGKWTALPSQDKNIEDHLEEDSSSDKSKSQLSDNETHVKI